MRYAKIDDELVLLSSGPRLPGHAHSVINHGSDPAVSRPPELDVVTWVGDVEPNNWQDGDIWEADYMLKDGSRAFTAPVGGVDPVDPAHLSTKAYVDNVEASGVSFTSSGLAVISGTSDVQAALAATDAALAERPTTQQIEDSVAAQVAGRRFCNTTIAIVDQTWVEIVMNATTRLDGVSVSGAGIGIQTEGWYYILGGVTWQVGSAGSASGRRQLGITLNGVRQIRNDEAASQSAVGMFHQASGLRYLDAGDVLGMEVNQATGGSIDVVGGSVTTFLSVARI